MIGQDDEAAELFERLLALRNDVGLLSEEYDPRYQRQVGNTPQAFSHVPLIQAALNLRPARWRAQPDRPAGRGPPAAWPAVTARARPMARSRPTPSAAAHGPRPHILVVNGRKVRQPVFVIGAPSSGTDLLARSLKRSDGFHLTLGQRWVIPVVQTFARRPVDARGQPEAAATVLRDAFAQAWQVTADCCLGCTQAVPGGRAAGQRRPVRHPAGPWPATGMPART